MSENVVRFGILGAARIAPAALIRPAAKNPEALVEAVAARDPERASAYAKRHRIPRRLRQLRSDLVRPGDRRRVHPPAERSPREMDARRVGRRKARVVREAVHRQRRRGRDRGGCGGESDGDFGDRGNGGVPLQVPPFSAPHAHDHPEWRAGPVETHRSLDVCTDPKQEGHPLSEPSGRWRHDGHGVLRGPSGAAC